MAEREIELDDAGQTDAGSDVNFKPNTETSPRNPSEFDYNAYATKKTIAKGLLDIALLTNNAAQLKLMIEFGEEHPYYVMMLVLVPISIALQVTVGILLLLLGNIKVPSQKTLLRAKTLNNAVTVLIFIIVVLNVIIAAFAAQRIPRPEYSPPTRVPPSKEP